MQDKSTHKALIKAKRWRSAIPPLAGAAIGVLLRAAFDFDPADSLWLHVEPWAAAIPLIEEWLRPNLTRGEWGSWLSSPLLLMLLFTALGKTAVGEGILNSIVRDPPWFASCDLEAERRRTMLNLEREPIPLIGREKVLSELDELSRGHDPFSWRALVGPTGIGKTRLGIEWLERLRKRGWDVGVVRSADLHALGSWKPRQRTALLIDDARRWWDKNLGTLLALLGEASSAGCNLRLLVVDQSEMGIELGLAEHRERLMKFRKAGPLRLGKMSDEEISALQEGLGFPVSQRVCDAAAGRPRAALLMLRGTADTYSDALQDWVRQIVPAVRDDLTPFPPWLAGPLLLSSLAGPIPINQVRAECGDVDTVPLRKFYDKSDGDSLDEILPLLEPDDFAVALAVALLPRIDAERRLALMHRALTWNISTVEDRLGTLSDWLGGSWRCGCGETEEVRWLRWMQERFDDVAPERVEAVRAHARNLLSQAQGAATAEEQRIHAEGACNAARRRPFDPELASIECSALAVEMRVCAHRSQFVALEVCSEKLLSLLGLRAMFRSANLDRGILEGIMAAADAYAAAGRPEDLIRWIVHLNGFAESLTDAERGEIRSDLAGAYANILHGLGLNRRIREVEAVGEQILALHGEARAEPATARAAALAAAHAVCAYGQMRKSAEMSRWLAQLLAICADPSFEDEVEIRALEAQGRADAVGHLCDLQLFSEAEKHWQPLTALARDERFSSDARFRLRHCEAAAVAVKYHGESGEYAGMERWALRLKRIAKKANPQADEEMGRRQLHGVCSAVTSFGAAERYDDMIRWAKYGLMVAKDGNLATSARVQEIAATLILNVAGLAGQAEMYDEVISWGEEALRLSEDPLFFDNYKIQDSIAQALGNILIASSRSGSRSSLFGSWMSFLARHAQHYDMHAGVQAVAAVFRLSATEQLLDFFPYGKFERRSSVLAGGSKEGSAKIESDTFAW